MKSERQGSGAFKGEKGDQTREWKVPVGETEDLEVAEGSLTDQAEVGAELKVEEASREDAGVSNDAHDIASSESEEGSTVVYSKDGGPLEDQVATQIKVEGLLPEGWQAGDKLPQDALQRTVELTRQFVAEKEAMEEADKPESKPEKPSFWENVKGLFG